MTLHPLRLAYFLCENCDREPSVLVTFCASCNNIACPHLFLGMRCFQCAPIDMDWPDWSMRFPLRAATGGHSENEA